MTKFSSRKSFTSITLRVLAFLFLLKVCGTSEVLGSNSSSFPLDRVIYSGEGNLTSLSLNPVPMRFITKEQAIDDWLGPGESNHDEYEDIIIRVSKKHSSKGAAYVIYGGPKGSLLSLNMSSRSQEGGANDEGMFRSFIGDVNNDGYEDIILIKGSGQSDMALKKSNNCPVHCNQCDDPLSCTECSEPFLLYKSQCLQYCPDDSYPSANRRECEIDFARLLASCGGTGGSGGGGGGGGGGGSPPPPTCPSQCSACAPAPSCTSCKPSYFLSGSSCVNPCPTKQVGWNGKCESCPPDCDTCSSPSVCTKCSLSFYLFADGCLTACPPATFALNHVCEDCATGCAQCTDLATCFKCYSGWFLYADQCITTCPVGTFASAFTGMCEVCPTGCAQCSDSSTCMICKPGWFLYLNKCMATCPEATFPFNGTLTGTCEGCPVQCETCTSLTSCQTCYKGYGLMNKLCSVPTSLGSEKKAAQAVSSAVTGIGSAACAGSPMFAATALVSQIVQNTRYLNLNVTDELAEVYRTWNTDMFSFDVPNGLSQFDLFTKSPPLFARYDLGSSFLMNFWSTLMTIGAGIAVLLVFVLVKLIFELANFKGRISALMKKLVAGLFNFVLVQAYGCLDDILFYLVLDIKTNPYNSAFAWVSLFGAIGFFALGCLILFFNFWTIRKYQNIKGQGSSQKNLEAFNERNQYWELFYSEFNDEDFLSQSTLALFIIRATVSTLIIAVLYEYPMMQTSFLVILDGAVILFLATKKPFLELRAKLAQYYFETITLLVHICTFTIALQDTFPSPSETLRKILCNGIMYLNTALVSGSLCFMGIELYEILRSRDEGKTGKKPLADEENTMNVSNNTTAENFNIQVRRSPMKGSLETPNSFSENSVSGILRKPAPTLSTNLDESVVLQDIETGGGEIHQVNQNQNPKMVRQKNRANKKKQQQQNMLDGLLLRNPTRHIRDFKRPEATGM